MRTNIVREFAHLFSFAVRFVRRNSTSKSLTHTHTNKRKGTVNEKERVCARISRTQRNKMKRVDQRKRKTKERRLWRTVIMMMAIAWNEMSPVRRTVKLLETFLLIDAAATTTTTAIAPIR
jgi:hypothetical protein